MGRVIVIDDEADMRMALRLFLERGGHAVDEAENGEQALAKIAGQSFDLALLDMRMPGMDGVQTLAKIRESHAALPVIMVTGYGSVDNTAEVLGLGASALVSKPFQHQELRDAMAKAGVADTEDGAQKKEERQRGLQRRRTLVKAFSVFSLLSSLFFLLAWQVGWLTNRTYKLAYTNPVDMTWRDGRLWVGDWFTQSIYIHDLKKAGAPIVKTYYLPDVHVSGIAVVGDRLYTSDTWAKRIRRHKLDDYLTIETPIVPPGESPTSLFFDGKYLWSIDSKTARIYQHRLDDRLTVLADYAAPGKAPVGFFKDDQFAWVSDSQTRRLYKLRLDDKLTVLGAYTLDDLQARGEPLSAFRWIDGDLWFARDRLNLLYKRSPRNLKRLQSE